MNLFKYPEKIFHKRTLYPYELIQLDVENFLHLFLIKNKEDIKNILIVGAWRGEEIDSFLRNPNTKIFCFEPDPNNFHYLKVKFSNNPRVRCFQYALGPENKDVDLFETDITGNNSCLEVIDSDRMQLKRKYQVEMKTLDSIKEILNQEIDLLWMDVQGFELEVLKGAQKTLTRCRSVFTEVGRNNPDYKNAVSYEDLSSYLIRSGFTHVAEGVLETATEVLAGNALFLKNDIKLPEIFFTKFDARLAALYSAEIWKRAVLGSKMSALLSRLLPIHLKLRIKKVFNL